MNPPIPTQPCAICGVKTNKTQSVIDVAHYKCFTKPREKCIYCGATETDAAILFGCICAGCYPKVPFEDRRQVIEDAAAAARDGSMSRNNSEALAGELLDAIKARK